MFIFEIVLTGDLMPAPRSPRLLPDRSSHLFHYQHLFQTFVTGALAVASLGCQTTLLDMRDLEGPVMLNALPYSEAEWKARPIDEFEAKVEYASGGTVTPYASTSTDVRRNTAQTQAFEKIGGYSDRAIAGTVLEIAGKGANFLFVFGGVSEIGVTGQVVEIEPMTLTETTDVYDEVDASQTTPSNAATLSDGTTIEPVSEPTTDRSSNSGSVGE
jgi:hypothetical protein